MVYTGYDAENECLVNPVYVVAGKSDGKTVQILEGLSPGMTYFYADYDTLEIASLPQGMKNPRFSDRG